MEVVPGKEFISFISDLESRLKHIDIVLEDYPVDHICYRAGSSVEYQALFNKFSELSILYTTKHFHERKFHLFVLKEPLKYKSISVPYLEFSQPGGSDNYDTGFQHLELHTNLKVEDLAKGNKLAKTLIFKGKYDDEAYLKWSDKTCLKVTRVPVVTKALLEDNPEIFLNPKKV